MASSSSVRASDIEPVEVSTTHVRPKHGDNAASVSPIASSSSGSKAHGVPELVGNSFDEVSNGDEHGAAGAQARLSEKRGWFEYMKTRDFWIVLLIGYVTQLNLDYTSWSSRINRLADRFSRCALQAPIPSLVCLPARGRASPLFRRSLTTFS